MTTLNTMKKTQAKLYLVVTPIGNLGDIAYRSIEVLNDVDIIACEDTRNSKKLLDKYEIKKKLISYHNFNEESSSEEILSFLMEGKDVALISDAGYPLISDPGYSLVIKAIENDIDISVVGGNNAGLNALIGSGLDTTHYLFYGFLSNKISSARKQLQDLKDQPYTLIFYEAPHRIERTIKLCIEELGNRKACIAREISKIHEEYIRADLKDILDNLTIKGEMVLVIEGKKEENIEIDFNDLFQEIDKLKSQGLKTKEAASIIAERYKISKNKLYSSYNKK